MCRGYVYDVCYLNKKEKKKKCSKLQDFKQNCKVKAAQLRQKGYPQTLIWEAYAKARDMPRDELLTYIKKNTSTSEQKIYMTTTYNVAYDSLRSHFFKNWDLLDRSSSTWQIHSLGLQVGYCRPKSLRDLLVRFKLPSCGDTVTHITGAPPKCDNPCCRNCPKLNTDDHIIASITGKKYRTRHNVSCNSNNLVYCISCTRYRKQYVGQTKNWGTSTR